MCSLLRKVVRTYTSVVPSAVSAVQTLDPFLWLAQVNSVRCSRETLYRSKVVSDFRSKPAFQDLAKRRTPLSCCQKCRMRIFRCSRSRKLSSTLQSNNHRTKSGNQMKLVASLNNSNDLTSQATRSLKIC